MNASWYDSHVIRRAALIILNVLRALRCRYVS
jgi:hypothetical protein